MAVQTLWCVHGAPSAAFLGGSLGFAQPKPTTSACTLPIPEAPMFGVDTV